MTPTKTGQDRMNQDLTEILQQNQQETQTRIENLEMTVAYQQEIIDALQTTAAQQFQDIQQLNHKLKLLSDYLKSNKQQNIKTQAEETPPPHY